MTTRRPMRMMLALLAMVSPAGICFAQAQSFDRIETDRDSFTPSTRTADRNRVIMEAAYTYLDHRGVPATHSFPEVLFRYGVTQAIELRLGWNYEIGGAGNDASSSVGFEKLETPRIERESRLLYGLKLQVTNQIRWVPETVVIVQGHSPTTSDIKKTDLTATAALGWELPYLWRLDGAIRFGTEVEADDHFVLWAPSVVLRAPFGERFNVHAEYFALFSRERSDNFMRHYFSPGVHFLVTPDFEIGLRAGVGLNDQSTRFFVNAGLGIRY